jgi:hypothetical protein
MDERPSDRCPRCQTRMTSGFISVGQSTWGDLVAPFGRPHLFFTPVAGGAIELLSPARPRHPGWHCSACRLSILWPPQSNASEPTS